MKKIIVVLSLILVSGISLIAQNKELKTVILNDGTEIQAYVENPSSGGYKVTTADGYVFFFSEKEVRSISGASHSAEKKTTKVKYRDLKCKYSARDYHGYEMGDKFSPAILGVASFLVPGLGQYITGCQVGWGVMQTSCLIAGATLLGLSISEMSFGYHQISLGYPYYLDYDAAYIRIGVGAALCLGMSIWSCCAAIKAAKVKNLYFRDMRNGVSYRFDVTPYFDLSSPTVASNQKPVAGVSFRIRF